MNYVENTAKYGKTRQITNNVTLRKYSVKTRQFTKRKFKKESITKGSRRTPLLRQHSNSLHEQQLDSTAMMSGIFNKAANAFGFRSSQFNGSSMNDAENGMFTITHSI